jgi:dolichyldiphosphatase
MAGVGEYQEMAESVPPALKAITLTHVRYRRGDPLGLFLAWVSLIPVFISLGGFVSHFLFRRELQGICFAAELLVSQFLNELIKHSVAQSRPAYCELLEACDSHGWPSSHSQYMFFFATYLSLLVLRRSPASRVMAAVTWPLTFLTMLSRVYLGYHTVAQVRGTEFRIRSDWERIAVQGHCFVPTSHAVLGFQRNIERIEL